MSEGGAGGIFISYRRQESGHVAGRLSDRLIDRFGPEQVFIDVEAIEPGADFAEVIERAVGGCAVLLAVIGPGWLRAADERGGRRLDDADDLVRLEIAAALARGVRVIPVLVEGATMPRRDELPASLAALTRRNALQVRHVSFGDDAGRLVAAVERALSASPAQAGAAPASPAAWAAPAAGDAWRGRTTDPVAAQHAIFRKAVVPMREVFGRRFVSKAERVADAMPDDVGKAIALGNIAEVVVVTDRARAARLVADAERIFSIAPDPLGFGSGLRDVARTVALVDAGRAERIANSVTVEPVRAAALGYVAEAVAVTDVGRAEYIAHSVSASYPKARALSRVALAAAADPGRAARLSAEAEQLAGGFSDDASREWVLSCVAGAVAFSDPDRADHLVGSITQAPARVQGLCLMAAAVVAVDPNRARRLADEAERVAGTLASAPLHPWALSCVAGAVALTDPNRAERIADSIAYAQARVAALAAIAKAHRS